MNILLLGGGGREHALAWKIAQSPLCDQLYIAPGNAGTAQEGENVAIDPNDFGAVKELVLAKEVQLVVCGPEEPLVRGLQNFFASQPELVEVHFIGPSQEGAQLEGSKAYAKEFMSELDIPTAQYRAFTKEQLEEGLTYLSNHPTPIVLKADGLAAGKGVLILDSVEQAQTEFQTMLDGKFGAASERVVVEQFLGGTEFSVFVLTDGSSYQLLPVAKDYKRIGAGDTGLNTGGMGSISAPPFVDDQLMQKVRERVIEPTLQGIRQRQLHYHGFIFFGLISVKGEPYVIEYNVRMGDPETQSVIPRLKTDLVQLCLALSEGRLNEITVEEDERATASVILVSGGYPGAYEKGKIIHGLNKVEKGLVFHAGTRQEDQQVVTNGGRVLAVTSYGDNFREALVLANKNARRIRFANVYFRYDIGFDLAL